MDRGSKQDLKAAVVSGYHQGGPWGVYLLRETAGPGNSSMSLSPHPALFPEWGECRRVTCHDIGSSMSSPSDQWRLCVLVIPSHTTFWVRAWRCRHTFLIPPEKRDRQVPSQGSGVAKPQLCTVSSGGKKRGVEVGSRELGCSDSALESLFPTHENR